MRIAAPCLMIVLSCSACTASDKYPSLAVRDVERVAGTLQPADAEPYVAPAPPSAVLDQIDRLTAEATRAHQDFLAEAPQARSAVAAARGAEPGADSWGRAQVALAGLEASRSRATIALADLDRIYVDAALEGTALDRIETARRSVAEQVDDQSQTIGTLQAELH